MNWFSTFDTDGVGGIDIEEFKSGFRKIDNTGLVEDVSGASLIGAIKSYVSVSIIKLLIVCSWLFLCSGDILITR